jgi:5'-nucleotidase / UDP-sugar diphosphatase
VTTVTVPYGGFARLKTLLDWYQQDDTSTNAVLKLHAGDALVVTPIYSIFQSQADAALMRQLCFDAFCLGNHVSCWWNGVFAVVSCVFDGLYSSTHQHAYLLSMTFLLHDSLHQELDDGDANLANFITALRSNSPCSSATPVLGANIVPGPNSPLRALQQSGGLAKSVKVLMGTTDTTVGIVGIDIRNKTLGSSRPDAGTTLLDERETARTEVQASADAGVKHIVLLTHIGYELDLAWMVDIPHVDVIVGGDSHSLLGSAATLGEVFTAVAPYPGVVTTTASGKTRTVCVVQAWEFAHGLGQLNVQFDDMGEVVTCHGHPVFPIGTPVLNNTNDATAVTSYLVGLGSSFVPMNEDQATLTALQNFTGQLSTLLAQTIATVPKDICFERVPGQGRSTICPVNASATQGGGVCNLVAQAFLSETLEADVAIQNAGG